MKSSLLRSAAFIALALFALPAIAAQLQQGSTSAFTPGDAICGGVADFGGSTATTIADCGVKPGAVSTGTTVPGHVITGGPSAGQTHDSGVPLGFDVGPAFATPLTGATVTIADTADALIIKPAAEIAALTVKLPTCSAAYNGKWAQFSSTQIVDALTVGSTAGTVASAPAALAVGGGVTYLCRGADTTWYEF